MSTRRNRMKSLRVSHRVRLGPLLMCFVLLCGQSPLHADLIGGPAPSEAAKIANPFVVSGGGSQSDESAGRSTALVTFGEAVATPPSADSDGSLGNGQSRAFLGFAQRIDPIKPGPLGAFSAVSGPDFGQITLSWLATGDDVRFNDIDVQGAHC